MWGSDILLVIDGCLLLYKVGHFTLDNASNNETMMATLEGMFTQRDITFDAHDHCIMYFAHVINLCSGWAILAASDRDADDDGYNLSNDAIVPSNPISWACIVVRVIWGSGQRRDTFDSTIKHGNKNGWFTKGESSEVTQVEPLQELGKYQISSHNWDVIEDIQTVLKVSHMQGIRHTLMKSCQ